MLGVRGCARQGVLFEYMCSHRVYIFANFSCLCSLRYVFNFIVSYVFPQGIQSQGFLIVFYVLSGSESGSPGVTTPSILVPSAKEERPVDWTMLPSLGYNISV